MMANKVYANNMEVACKAAAGKAICAFPDVCFTPPQTPATPPGVPVPYPNTGMASDTSNGSRSVKISGKEVMLKNKSYFKKSTGDEAGCAPKKGIVTSRNTGKVYFNAWSMDVKVEGENVVRNLDLTTHNHGSFPSNTGPWPYLDTAAVSPGGACHDDAEKEKSACSEFAPHGSEDMCESLKPLPYKVKPRYAKSGKPSGSMDSGDAEKLARHTAAKDCMNARRCFLQPYKPKGGIQGCCSPQTGHHLIEASSLFDTGRGGADSTPLQGITPGKYDEDAAPCVCAEGINQNTGSHGWMHTFQSLEAMKMPEEALTLSTGKKLPKQPAQTYKQAKENAFKAMRKVFPLSFCSPDCIEKQLDNYHNQCGVQDTTKIKAVVEGQTSPEAVSQAQSHLDDIVREGQDRMLDNYARALDDMLDGLGVFRWH
ncbi:PAAR-like domain-containing protein [Aquabacterium sp. A7-Y]|uniref:PAAR-like domain-containing protein n=1 Tax=Aquabacterium sp. A7-Y TaxID=1349605 RepID=UPI002AC85E4B|nr:PAAR-like domain-containing protein [Aquabacterium sp. A7-Y]